MTIKNCFGVTLVALCLFSSANAQKKELTLDDAINSWRIIPTKTPSSLNWKTGSAGDMPYEKATTEQDNRYEAVNCDETFALRFTNKKRVWRYETRGDYFIVNLKNGEQRQLGANLPKSSLMFAKFSPDGKHVAYVSKNNIYLEDCANSNSQKALTTDGNDTIVNGTFDWVYEEEFDCRDGFRWSGDSKYIAFWHSNTSGTGWFDIINNVDSIYPTVQHFPYPKAGTQNSAVSVKIVDINDGTKTDIAIPGNARENYLPRMEFAPGTNRLMIQQMNRPQNTNTVWSCNIVDGKAQGLSVLCVDKDAAWVETNDNIHWLKGNKYFTFTSERDGWRHLYRVSADGKKWKCITDAELDVISEVAFDEKRGYIYFIATPENQATERYLYRAKIYGNGKCEKISGTKKGQYSYSFSPSCDYATETYSNASTAPQYSLIRFDKKGNWTVEKSLEDNAKATAAFNNLAIGHKEFTKCTSGDLELDAWIIKPFNFDPKKKYPVIDFVYGEPASATVQDVWSRSLFWHYLANQGFIVVSIENRGANAPRGRQWRKCIYGEVGVKSSEDQARGIMDLCRKYEYMDSTRIGVTGWSGGGSMTLNCMFRYPDIFKTGVAIAFVSDQKLYDTIYQERYMNTPQNNPDGYFKGSPINFTQGLKGNLLLIHGTGDDNVHYQNCEMLVNKLIENGKLFYQISYPMRTHGIYERKGTSLHLRNSLVEFFKKNL
ncbi:MAG: S9 family peptidase [Bacteroidaceae bacterium]|nr:S9 family peptidase [Bacteroidaceae bacterium]